MFTRLEYNANCIIKICSLYNNRILYKQYSLSLEGQSKLTHTYKTVGASFRMKSHMISLRDPTNLNIFVWVNAASKYT